MNISAETIKDIRSRTGAGIVDCRDALQETGGDIEAAVKLLREKGKIKAAKKAQREAKEGFIGSYVHTSGKIASFVSVRCETDFVARNPSFLELAKDLAMQVAAMGPLAVSADQMPADLMAEERALALKEAENSGKPKEIAEKMVQGKLDKFAKENALLSQIFVKDQSITVGDYVTRKIAELGENIVVDKFVKFEL